MVYKGFKFRDNYSAPVSATIIGNELERLRRENGGFIAAEQVLESARTPQSVIRPCFPWDDREAAELHRLDVARKLIRCVVPIFDGPVRRQPEVFLVHVVKEGKHCYTPMSVVVEDPELHDQVMDEAIAGLRGWQKRFGDINGFELLYREIARVIEDFERRRKRKPPPHPPQDDPPVVDTP